MPKILPSTTAAGAKFNAVREAAGNVPVSLDQSSDGILSLMDWQKKAQLGPTVNKFLNRVTAPNQGPMTYDEARKFYQLLGNLSADESSKLAPAVKYDLTRTVAGLKQDIGTAADQVGQGQQYFSAMREFSQAKKLEDLKAGTRDTILKALKVAAGSGIAGFAAKEGYDALKSGR